MKYSLSIMTYRNQEHVFDTFEADTDKIALDISHELINNWEHTNNDLSYRVHLFNETENKYIS